MIHSYVWKAWRSCSGNLTWIQYCVRYKILSLMITSLILIYHFDEGQIGLFNVFVTTLIKRQIHSSEGCSVKSSNKVFWAFTVPFYVFLSSFLSESDSTLFCRHSGSKCSTKTVFREQGCSISPLLKSQRFDRLFSVSSQN